MLVLLKCTGRETVCNFRVHQSEQGVGGILLLSLVDEKHIDTPLESKVVNTLWRKTGYICGPSFFFSLSLVGEIPTDHHFGSESVHSAATLSRFFIKEKLSGYFRIEYCIRMLGSRLLSLRMRRRTWFCYDEGWERTQVLYSIVEHTRSILCCFPCSITFEAPWSIKARSRLGLLISECTCAYLLLIIMNREMCTLN